MKHLTITILLLLLSSLATAQNFTVSGTITDARNGETLIGSPVIPPTNYFKSYAIFRRLPDMYKTLSRMEKEIQELKAQLNKNE